MPKTIEQLEVDLKKAEAALSRAEDYSFKLNDKIAKLEERLKNSISILEHEKIVSQIKSGQHRTHNERGAGRKKVADKAVVKRVLALRDDGLSHAKIAKRILREDSVSSVAQRPVKL